MKSWSAEEKRTVEALVQEGHSYGQIADRMGTSRNAICGLARRTGLSRPGRTLQDWGREVGKLPPDWSADEDALLAQLVGLGWTWSAIGRRLDRAAEACARRGDKLGLSRSARPRHPKPPAVAPAPLPRRCQWIEGDPSADEACKCGAPTQRGLPYCPRHAARAYQMGPRA